MHFLSLENFEHFLNPILDLKNEILRFEVQLLDHTACGKEGRWLC